MNVDGKISPNEAAEKANLPLNVLGPNSKNGLPDWFVTVDKNENGFIEPDEFDNNGLLSEDVLYINDTMGIDIRAGNVAIDIFF